MIYSIAKKNRKGYFEIHTRIKNFSTGIYIHVEFVKKSPTIQNPMITYYYPKDKFTV